jgi:hypothetical protein
LTPPFVVDFLTQEDHSLKPPPKDWWATTRPDRTSGLACSRHALQKEEWISMWTRALREVAGSLLRDLTTKTSAKSATERFGREYWALLYVEQ